MDDKKKDIEYELADIITQKPHEIKVGRKLYVSKNAFIRWLEGKEAGR